MVFNVCLLPFSTTEAASGVCNAHHNGKFRCRTYLSLCQSIPTPTRFGRFATFCCCCIHLTQMSGHIPCAQFSVPRCEWVERIERCQTAPADPDDTVHCSPCLTIHAGRPHVIPNSALNLFRTLQPKHGAVHQAV